MKKIKGQFKSYSVLVLGLLIGYLGNAQSKGIKVGELLPSGLQGRVLFDDTDYIKLDDQANKVVILDFFDTYCNNCIATLPKLQKLQSEFGDSLKIIVVTWQDSATITRFFNTSKFLREKKVSLPVIVSDTSLNQLFKHKGLPHVAWLHKNKVAAITFSDFSTKENVQQLYTRGTIRLPLKNDFGNTGAESAMDIPLLQKGAVSLTGYKDGEPEHGFTVYRDTLGYGTYGVLKNTSILGAYTSIWTKIRKPTFLLNNERIVWEVSDPNNYKRLSDQFSHMEWLLNYGICYERKVGGRIDEADFAKTALQDLNQFLGLEVYWDKRVQDCLVIKKVKVKKSTSKKPGKDGEDENNLGIEGSEVLAFYLDYSKKYPPCIDLANRKINMTIGHFETLEELNDQLAVYGLAVSAERRPIEVLVVREK